MEGASSDCHLAIAKSFEVDCIESGEIQVTVSPELISSIVYASDSKTVWDDFKESFDKSNLTRIYQLWKEIAILLQGTDSVTTYFSRLKDLWDEIDGLIPGPGCNCDENKPFIEHLRQRRLLQFLMGLNESFGHCPRFVLVPGIHYGSQHMHDVIDQILANRKKNNIPMQNFSLWLGYYHPRLNLREKPDNVYYSLPETIFSAKSLTVLSLEGFKIELPADEHLSLRYFNGLTSFQVGETLPKLKKVNLVNQENLGYDHSVLQLIDIAAINVEDLSINNHSHGNINAVRVTDCKTLKSFYLNCVDITDNWLEELFYSLQNLEKFDLT
ncbi:putative serine/threonine-protein kinase EDR1-like [Capsicum annuum]|nr:putative serine/threonine-protein kinase EDR1-like [Capsicum annuum]